MDRERVPIVRRDATSRGGLHVLTALGGVAAFVLLLLAIIGTSGGVLAVLAVIAVLLIVGGVIVRAIESR